MVVISMTMIAYVIGPYKVGILFAWMSVYYQVLYVSGKQCFCVWMGGFF